MTEELKITPSSEQEIEKPVEIFCSFLLPSRARPQRCLRAIESILKESNNRRDILVRIDEDDPYLDQYDEIRGFERVKIFTGKRVGYNGLSKILSDLAEETNAKWLCMWNDDMLFEGDGFDAKLSSVPESGYIVQQAIHKLGGATFYKHHGGPATIFPNKCWQQFGYDHLPHPADTFLDQCLRVKNGWQTWWLDGIAVNHQRDSDDVIMKHRL